MHDYWLAPSILSADLARLGQDVERVLAAGADLIHFDVMDNHYVPNLTFGPIVCQALRRYGITAPIDVHLMVRPVDNLALAFAQAGATYISFHPDASDHVDRTLQLIRDHGSKAGLALNPASGTHLLEYVMDKLDMILLMTVNPGFAGQNFIPGMLNKIAKVRALIDQHQLPIRLAVDGGVNAANIGEIARCGADTFIAGSAIFGTADYQATIAKMRAALNEK